MRKIFDKIPVGLFTTLVVMAILWLTLLPDPIPHPDGGGFYMFDKVGHFFMFGGLCFAASFDRRLASVRGRVGVPRCRWFFPVLLTMVATAFGAIIELLQYLMDVGRSAEFADLLSDFLGAALFSFVSPFLLLYIIRCK